MAFNSFSFVFVFLPLTLLAYWLVALSPLRRFRRAVLALATLIFYAKGAAVFLPLLLGSILANWALGKAVARSEGPRKSAWVTAAVLLNVGVLVYFKYLNFLASSVAAALGLHYAAPHIPLPLAISFFTFQQVAYILDVSRGSSRAATLSEQLGYILFFPALISGPIVFFRELNPQLETPPDRAKLVSNLATGATLFALGLFKKTVIADTFALWVDPAFSAVNGNAHLGAGAAWGVAVAYVLQLYFDFSGYTDMAIGCARLFGIALPMNFYSPLRATSISEYWRRWHMTLSRWVNIYIFQPLAIPAARLASDRNLEGYAALTVSTLLPTMLSMLIIGAWHGGRWTYVVFGAMHGIYLIVNEVWNYTWRKARRGKPEPFARKVRGNVVSMLAVALAIVPFRSDDMVTATRVWAGMFGANGLAGDWSAWGAMPTLGPAGLLLVILPAGLFAYLLPNSEQFMTLFTPALEWNKWRKVSPPLVKAVWRPTPAWSLFTGAVLLLGLAYIARGGASFVYFNF